MNTEKTNDIKVEDYIDVSAILRQVDIENAKQVLKREGYFVDALYNTMDITMNYHCTEEQAQTVLFEALTLDSTEQFVFEMIHHVAKIMKLKSID